MGLFSKIWNGVKRAGARVWRKVIRPSIERVADWLRIDKRKTSEFLDGVEGATRKVVTVLDTEVAVLLRRAWAEADRWFETWLVRNLGPLAAPLLSLKRALDGWLWDPVADPMPIPVPVPVQTPPLLRVDGSEEA